ncbi:DUF2169 family type VI secretion system accessory protein [Trabulsiella odontotermitis]|uniref:DUF2169 domain-containing protein n=1 Tax=Trabulsiella odontotermitis TaxID=379893 RepID=A0A0L0GNS7_9ENTR|nr:pentapeptide repeat-containing protein [Trabulsiella odontotermitis]KNC90612.1 hypothetical protein GM30_02205 [Trabulsiella odontotermitis]KNC95698.1 hypothetical protein GM31_23460 [Trabulsiella odontotermitis]
MRIIRPQQLAVLKNGYQIGRDSHMGISVVAGFYLSRQDHFITEPQIWHAWKSAPISFRVLDSVEPKPFAEFLLAGHAGIGEEVNALDVMARVGPLKRHWRVEGDSGTAGMTVKPFLRMPLDHTHSWGGKGCKENALGRGYGDSQHPNLMSINIDGSAIVRSPLAAPTPLPPDFQIRKNHMDNVASSMSDKHYLETFFPGLPPGIDRRYFQMAAPAQWLNKAEWPNGISFELQGFREHNEVLSGDFPVVRARAFVWENDAKYPEEIVLQRKTLWLLPDDDIGLMVFTGHYPLKHLFDEPVETLLVALDPATSLRDEAHYCDVYARRSHEDAPAFEFLNDPDLMPVGMPLNVIRSLTDHPDSKFYSALPLPKADTTHFYDDVKEAIALYQQQQQARKESDNASSPGINETMLPALPEGQGETWLSEGNAEAENITFSGTDFSASLLENKQFRYCTFHNCKFKATQLKDCVFEQCQFILCDFDGSSFSGVTLSGGFIKHSHLQDVQIENSLLEKVTLESSGFQMSHFIKSSLNNNIMMQDDFSHCRFDSCSFNNGFFTFSIFSSASFLQSQVVSSVFEKCETQNVSFSHCTLNKNSFIEGTWQNSQFMACQMDSVTTGLGVSFSDSRFEQCSLVRIGFTKADLQRCHFVHCTLLEACCDKADFDSAHVISCDMAGLRLKDAVLTHSLWRGTSLQQSVLYNADLRDTTFRQCNLAGANLAMVSQNVTTRFDGCLMEHVHWIPRRYRMNT